MRSLLFFLCCFCLIQKIKALEYPDQASYLLANPLGKHDGNDGHWLKTDRKHHNAIWSRANTVNLLKADGFNQYRDIAERSDFYKWFQHQTDSVGFETKWAGIAAITTGKLSKLLSEVPRLTGNSNLEIQHFVQYGNQLIFEDIWPDLQNLYTGICLKGKAAEQWDGELLLREQRLIDPSYQKLSSHSLRMLAKSLRRENLLSKFIPGLEFEGNLLNIRDRWSYGMRMMGYKHLN